MMGKHHLWSPAGVAMVPNVHHGLGSHFNQRQAPVSIYSLGNTAVMIKDRSCSARIYIKTRKESSTEHRRFMSTYSHYTDDWECTLLCV